jgi:ABC-type amino acid transport substrate-binding protein
MVIRRRACLVGIAVMAMLSLAPSKPVMRYVYDGPESARDVRYQYHWEILRTALEKTRPKWGDYLMVASEPMAEQRQRLELMNATGGLNVMYVSTTPEFERTLLGIHIPVDKNLGGYGLFLIRDGEQARFRGIRTLDDLRKFSYGVGLGWIDVGILRANRFNVVTGSSYDGLFDMLENKRFDVFVRAATEVLDEYEKQKGKENRLAIEQTILFYYPLPMYFWFPKTEEGRRLAARAEEGMRMMIADGTYDQIFDKYHRHKIETLRLKERKLFKIMNPNVGPETPFADKTLWFDPRTYR